MSDVVIANDPPPPEGGKPRQARVLLPARHVIDPGRTPHPTVVAEIDATFAKMTPPCRRTGDPQRMTATQLARLTGAQPSQFAGWPEWWMAEGEEILR